MTDTAKPAPYKRGGNAGKGRRPGVPNKINRTLKEAILLAAEAAGGGGNEGLVAYLTQQATAEPVAFLSLLGKVLPLTLAGDPNAPVSIKVTLGGADH